MVVEIRNMVHNLMVDVVVIKEEIVIIMIGVIMEETLIIIVGEVMVNVEIMGTVIIVIEVIEDIIEIINSLDLLEEEMKKVVAFKIVSSIGKRVELNKVSNNLKDNLCKISLNHNNKMMILKMTQIKEIFIKDNKANLTKEEDKIEEEEVIVILYMLET